MTKYTKFITAIVGAILAGLATFTGFEITWTAGQVVSVIMPGLTALAVWLFPNKV